MASSKPDSDESRTRKQIARFEASSGIFANRSKAITSVKNITFGLFVRAFLIIAYLKLKICREFPYTASRTLSINVFSIQFIASYIWHCGAHSAHISELLLSDSIIYIQTS